MLCLMREFTREVTFANAFWSYLSKDFHLGWLYLNNSWLFSHDPFSWLCCDWQKYKSVLSSPVEGETHRIQIFEGLVIKRQGHGVSATFTVRKISYGVGVERTFPVNAPIIDSIQVIRKGKVRRAYLGYIRGLSAKAARIDERR